MKGWYHWPKDFSWKSLSFSYIQLADLGWYINIPYLQFAGQTVKPAPECSGLLPYPQYQVSVPLEQTHVALCRWKKSMCYYTQPVNISSVCMNKLWHSCLGNGYKFVTCWGRSSQFNFDLPKLIYTTKLIYMYEYQYQPTSKIFHNIKISHSPTQ